MKHGHSTRKGGTTPTYKSWSNMMTRCRNPNSEKYPKYGGRGIKVCARWYKFENFLADMGERPPGHTLERKDVNGDYGPGNCVWATDLTQARNKQSTVYLEVGGVRKPLMEWAESTGVPYDTLHDRMGKGWSPEEVIKPKSVVTLTVGGVTRTLKEWSVVTGLHTECLRGRLKMGWAPERIISKEIEQ